MVKVTGGEKLEAYLSKLSQSVRSAGKVKAGFLAGATYPGGQSVAMVAVWQNYGTKTVPPTRFLSDTALNRGEAWGEALGRALVHTDFDTKQALALVGEEMIGDIRAGIIAVDSPPLSPITLMLRKMFGNHPEDITGAAVGEAARRVAAGEDYSGVSDKRLIWTGHLLGSIDKEVV